MKLVDRLKKLAKESGMKNVRIKVVEIEHDASNCGPNCVVCSEVKRSLNEFFEGFNGDH